MLKSMSRLAAIVAMLGSTLAAHPASAATVVAWDGGGATDRWDDPLNWSTDSVPGPGDCAVVDSGNTVVVSRGTVATPGGILAYGTIDIVRNGRLILRDPRLCVPVIPPEPGQGQSQSQIWNLHNDGLLAAYRGALDLLGGASGHGTYGGVGKGRVQFGGGGTFTLDDRARLAGNVWVAIPNRFLGSDHCGNSPPCPEGARIVVPAGATALSVGSNHLIGGSYLAGAGTFVVTPNSVLHWSADPDGPSTMLGPGRTLVAPGGRLEVDGPFGHAFMPGASDGVYGCGNFLCGGVQLGGATPSDAARTLDNRGMTRLSNAGFIAAAWGSTFLNSGTFAIANDRGYYQGFTGTGSDRSALVHTGIIRKEGTLPETVDGPEAASILDAVLTGGGTYEVVAGTLSVPDAGGEITGTVDPGQILATGICPTSQVVPACDRSATGGDPQLTAVRTSSASDAGAVSILEGAPNTEPAPPGFEPVGQLVDIEAPAGAAAAPGEIRLTLDASLVGGITPADVRLYRNGVLIPGCAGPGASPDPCVSVRAELTGGLHEGDFLFVILTSASSRYKVDRKIQN